MEKEKIEKIELLKINDINKVYDIQIVYSREDKEEIMKHNNVGLIKLTNKKHPPNPPKPPQWFIPFIDKLDVVANKLDKFIIEQTKFNKMIVARLDGIENRLNNIVIKNNLKE